MKALHLAISAIGAPPAQADPGPGPGRSPDPSFSAQPGKS